MYSIIIATKYCFNIIELTSDLYCTLHFRLISLRLNIFQISYTYQVIYIVGCTLTNIYGIALGLWPLYIPCLFEESLIIALTLMKILYDRREREEKDQSHLTIKELHSIPKENNHTKAGEGVAAEERC